MSKEGKMEKSFLNFKAAHPDWMPSDPTGSLYLSRMADYRASMQPAVSNGGGMGAGGTSPHKRVPNDAARKYDRALLESQTAATRRRSGRHVTSAGMGASTAGLAASTMVNQTPAPVGESIMLGTTAGLGLARTTMLGDSAGSVVFARSPPATTPHQSSARARTIAPADRTPDNGVGSALGESYADPAASGPDDGAEPDDSALEDGGVLGLLAQIYGTKGRAQGPARAI
jgi:autophagy-related protein 9